MKIVEYSKGSITEVENVFKVVESGAQGPEGTIGKLTTLTNKPIVIPADLALTGDSEAAFANKYSTWQQLIDTVLSLFANNISDVNATALTDGGETALHSHAGGGGGGGEYEVVETRPMTGNAIELFTVGADDVIKLVLTSLRFSAVSFLNISLSIDAGATYPSKHTFVRLYHNSGVVTPAGFGIANHTSFTMYDASSPRRTADGDIILTGIADASEITVARRIRYAGFTSPTIGEMFSSGAFDQTGVVNKIKVATNGGATIDAGTITLLRRTY